MIHYLHGLKMDVGKILTHCRACGVEKEEEVLFKCDWCGGRFCGLHYYSYEELCFECFRDKLVKYIKHIIVMRNEVRRRN